MAIGNALRVLKIIKFPEKEIKIKEVKFIL